MSNINTGGPAFPPPFDVVLMAALTPQTGALGMTLRDYFAAKAMQTLLLDDSYDFSDRDLIAQKAYAYADALLKAREA
jgi:hypothetical protein